MRYAITLILTVLTAAGANLLAQNGNAHATGGGNPHTTPATTTHGKPTTGTTTHGKPTTTTATGTTTTGTTTTGTTTDVTATTPTTTFVKNAALEQKLKAMLPTGTNMNDAAKGFKNWGQFVAAVHVSQNLNIPFSQLKAKMIGSTPGSLSAASTPMSLGQAIQAVKSTPTTGTTTGTTTSTPTTTKSTTTKTATTTTTATVQAQVTKAESEAAEDLRQAKDDRHR